MPLVSFAADIRPLFRTDDVDCMKDIGVMLDDHAYMSDPANSHENAQHVLDALSPQNGKPPFMPPGGPHWTPEQLALFAKWRSDGYQP